MPRWPGRARKRERTDDEASQNASNQPLECVKVAKIEPMEPEMQKESTTEYSNEQLPSCSKSVKEEPFVEIDGLEDEAPDDTADDPPPPVLEMEKRQRRRRINKQRFSPPPQSRAAPQIRNWIKTDVDDVTGLNHLNVHKMVNQMTVMNEMLHPQIKDAVRVAEDIGGVEEDVKEEDFQVYVGTAEQRVCGICHRLFDSATEATEHRIGLHKSTVKRADDGTGLDRTLLCPYQHCSTFFSAVPHLAAHLVGAHNQRSYRIRRICFDSLHKFETWKMEVEKAAKFSFMTTADQVDSENRDVYNINMYCEYCDDWRETIKHRDTGDSNGTKKIPPKLIGCPAHFTAKINNAENRVEVVGCFGHMGHVKRSPWMQHAQSFSTFKERTARLPMSAECPKCGIMFRSKTKMKEHMTNVHRGGPKRHCKRPTMECGDPECGVICDSMATLCEHVATAHDRDDLQIEEYKFRSEKDFDEWRQRLENDSCSKYIKISARRVPEEYSAYFICHLSGTTPKRNNDLSQESNIKSRVRGTKKMGRYCTAFMNVKINHQDGGSVTMRGCLGHFGHPFDVRRLPLPEHIRQQVMQLLERNVTDEAILASIRNKCSSTERGYYLKRYEIRNIALKMQKEGHLQRPSHVYLDFEDEEIIQEEADYPRHGGRSLEQIHTDSMRRRYQTTNGMYRNPRLVQEDLIYEDESMMEMDEMVLVDGGLYESEHYMPLETSRCLVRGRIPLLRNIVDTGEPEFDVVMADVRRQIESVQARIRQSRDVQQAEELLQELRQLEARFVQGIGQTVTMTSTPMQAIMEGSGGEWIIDGYDEEGPYEEVEGEVEVAAEGDLEMHGEIVEEVVVVDTEDEQRHSSI